MMARTVVRQLRLEVQAADSPVARQLPERLSQLYHGQLARVLDEELASLAARYPAYVLRQLVVEVPAVAADRLEQDLPDLLRAAVRAALAALPETAAPTTALLTQLRELLLSGSLPWQLVPHHTLDDLLRPVLRQQPGALRQLLLRLGPQLVVRQRLARQASDPTFDKLLELLEAAHASLLCTYLHQTLAAHHQRPLVPTSLAVLRVLLRELLLADLLVQRHTRFNRRAFIERQLRQLAAYHGVAYQPLLAQLLSVLVTESAPSSLLTILRELAGAAQAGGPPASTLLPNADALPLLAGFAAVAGPDTNPTPSSEPAGRLAGEAAPLWAADSAAAVEARQTALCYYLRYATLPYTSGQRVNRADLFADFAAVLRQGEPALRQLLRAAGPAAARTLAKYFPAATGWRVVRLLMPGLARPAADLLASLPAQTALPVTGQVAYRAVLWEGIMRYATATTMATSAPASPQALRQWLLRHAAPEAPPALLAAPNPAFLPPPLAAYLFTGEMPTATTLAGLRLDLHALPSAAMRELRALLRHYAGFYPVLHRLAALATPAELVRLKPGSSVLSDSWVLAAATGPTARATWLREAFLVFYLRSYWDGRPPAPSEARRLLATYRLPARAMRRYLARHLASVSGFPVKRSSFASWLLVGCAEPAAATTAQPAATYPQPNTTWLPGELNEHAHPGHSFTPRLLTQRRPLASRVAGPLRLAAPQTITDAVEALVAHLLRDAKLAPPLARALLRQVVRRQPGQLWGRLRRAGAGLAVWERLARLASLAELASLVAGAATHGHPRAAVAARALAALDAPMGGAGATGQLFLKIALLSFHAQPTAGRLPVSAAQQLAATLRLPWRALLAQLQRWQQQWPALAAAPFFARFWPRVRATAAGGPTSPPAPGQLAGPELAYPSFAPELNRPDHTATATAATDTLLHYLLHGQAPWWAGPAMPAWLALLRQARAQPALRQFVQRHGHLAAVRQRLARLADFSLLHELTAARGPGRAQRQLLRPALGHLDHLLRTDPAAPGSRLRLFLREAFLAVATARQPAAGLLPGLIRQLAAAAGLSWRSVLAYTNRLVQRLPALAAAPFFATLLQAAGARAGAVRAVVRTAARAASAPAARAAGPALEYYLQTGLAASQAAQELAALAAGGGPAPAGLIHSRQYLRLAVGRQRLAALMPSARELLPVLRALFPAAHRQLAAPLREWLALLAGGHVRLGTRPADLWAEVLAAAQAPWPAAALAQALVRGELAAGSQPLTESRLRATSQRLLRLAGGPLRSRRSALAALLAATLAQPVESSPSSKPALSARPRPAAPPPAAPPASYLPNAGVVLLWPLLQVLFDRLGYLEQRQFRDAAGAERAVHLLHFLATGEENPAEPLLTLAKLLCGVEPGHPVVRELPLTAAEKTTGEELLRVVLGRWEALKNTSIAGLRETFLQREGKLAWLPDRATLTVETKTLDILLDRLPWSIALIKLPWMALPLYVTWR